MYFLENTYSPKPLDEVTSNLHKCIGHMMWRVLDNSLSESQGHGHLMYFLVNASHKPLYVATSNFISAYVT